MIDARIAALSASLDEYVPQYPPHAVERPTAFALGTAFFPVGSGLWKPREALPSTPIAIVAHVFDASSVAYALGPGGGNERIDGNRTWQGLRTLLERAGVSIEACWLTNALMGVKVGKPCGPVAAGKGYHRACAAFLRAQIETVQPRVVATLGSSAMRVLRAASDDLGERWKGYETLDALDRAEPPAHAQRDVRFGEHVVARVVALSHTCSWTSRRSYRGERGARADAALLRDAVAATIVDGGPQCPST